MTFIYRFSDVFLIFKHNNCCNIFKPSIARNSIWEPFIKKCNGNGFKKMHWFIRICTCMFHAIAWLSYYVWLLMDLKMNVKILNRSMQSKSTRYLCRIQTVLVGMSRAGYVNCQEMLNEKFYQKRWPMFKMLASS